MNMMIHRRLVIFCVCITYEENRNQANKQRADCQLRARNLRSLITNTVFRLRFLMVTPITRTYRMVVVCWKFYFLDRIVNFLATNNIIKELKIIQLESALTTRYNAWFHARRICFIAFTVHIT